MPCLGQAVLAADIRHYGTLGPAATKRNVLSLVRGKTIVHFAVHCQVDTQFDSNSAAALALTPDTHLPRDNGLLTLQEVYALPLGDCELAVLRYPIQPGTESKLGG